MGKSSADYDYSGGESLMKQGSPNTYGTITNDSFGDSPLGSGLAILIAAGTGYAMVRRKRSRKNTMLLLACVVLLGFTQCKKEQPIEPETQGEKVSITLTVDGGNSNDSRVNVDPPHVTFEQGDKILVGYDGKYVGTITHDGTSFSGEIDATVTTPKQKLFFFFIGNKDDVNLSVGNSTCTIDISDQTAELPVLSFSESDQDFNGAGSYTAQLHNQCALVQFTTNEIPVWTAVNISGMKNKVTVNFGSNSITPTGETGNIALHAKDATSRWAILLPQDAVTATATAIEYNPTGSVSVPAINTNDYLTGDDGCSFEMTPDGTFNALHTPLTFEAKTAGATVTFTIASVATNPVRYSTNGSTWKNYSSGTAVTLENIGDKVSFCGDNAKYSISFNSDCSTISCSRDCYIYGNIMSLVNSTDYADDKTLSESNVFCKLFYNNTHIVNHPSKTLELPATTLTTECYRYMFYGCSGLTRASALPATTLDVCCYYSMFDGCTNLATAPELSATTLANYCYMYMFEDCSSLTTAPALPARTLVKYCYYYMFKGCTNLTSVTCLAMYGINTNESTKGWLNGVPKTGTFTKNAYTPTGSTGYTGQYWPTNDAGGIPDGWTVVDAN